VVENSTMIAAADSLHEKAHAKCFIANSVSFPVGCRGLTRTSG
jgi:organic hydroperoxide reductase OsmC/OhrA